MDNIAGGQADVATMGARNAEGVEAEIKDRTEVKPRDLCMAEFRQQKHVDQPADTVSIPFADPIDTVSKPSANSIDTTGTEREGKERKGK